MERQNISVDNLSHNDFLTDKLADRAYEVVKDFPDNLRITEIDHARRRLKDIHKRGHKGVPILDKPKDTERPLEWDKFLIDLRRENPITASAVLSVIGVMREHGFLTLGDLKNPQKYIVREDGLCGIAGRGHFSKITTFSYRAFVKREESSAPAS